MRGDILISLLLEFSLISILAFGGMTAVLPELQRRVIDSRAWVDQRTFTDLYSMGYAMPGPNVLVGTLIGFHLAGAAGALVATIALILPAAALTFFLARIWHDFRQSFWRRAIQRGLLPITVGLTLAGGYLVASGANESWMAYAPTLATIIVVMRSRFHPLWMVAIGAALGGMGWV